MRPTNEQIEAVFQHRGSIRATAAELQVADSTLRGWAKTDHELYEILYETPNLTTAAKEQEIRDLKRVNKQLSEREGRRQEWIQEVVEAAQRPVSLPEIVVKPRSSRLPSRSIVLPIFDIQYGQHVQKVDVPFGMGGFSEEVFDQRARMYLTKVTEYMEDRSSSVNFEELHLILGGDMVEGHGIYRGMEWQLGLHPIKQVLNLRAKMSYLLGQIITKARELGVKKVALYVVPGNHGKVGGKMAGAIPADYSWDYLLGELVINDLAGAIDLAVNEAAGAILFKTMGHTFLTIHGDEIKGVSGIPAYGMAKADGRLIRMSEIIHDYLIMGHHHQPTSIPNGGGGESIIVGDWVGPNNLSRQIQAGSRPQQSLLLVARKHGLVTTEKIYLDGEDRSNRRRAHVYNVAA